MNFDDKIAGDDGFIDLGTIGRGIELLNDDKSFRKPSPSVVPTGEELSPSAETSVPPTPPPPPLTFTTPPPLTNSLAKQTPFEELKKVLESSLAKAELELGMLEKAQDRADDDGDCSDLLKAEFGEEAITLEDFLDEEDELLSVAPPPPPMNAAPSSQTHADDDKNRPSKNILSSPTFTSSLPIDKETLDKRREEENLKMEFPCISDDLVGASTKLLEPEDYEKASSCKANASPSPNKALTSMFQASFENLKLQYSK